MWRAVNTFRPLERVALTHWGSFGGEPAAIEARSSRKFPARIAQERLSRASQQEVFSQLAVVLSCRERILEALRSRRDEPRRAESPGPGAVSAGCKIHAARHSTAAPVPYRITLAGRNVACSNDSIYPSPDLSPSTRGITSARKRLY